MLACLCVLTATPAAARAQADTRPVARVDMDARLAARLDPETGRLVAQVLDEARRQQLPVEPLVDKALEGASKRAPGARIVDAVRRLSGELAESRRLLGPQASPEEVTAGAHALRAKIAPESLERLRRKRGRTTLIASLGVYQELVAQKVVPDTAAGVVVSLHEAGVSSEQLAGFQDEMARKIAVGGSPSIAAAITTELMVGDGLVAANVPGTFNTDTRALGESGSNRPPKRKP